MINASALTPADIVTAAGFIAVVIAALAWQSFRNAMANSPRHLTRDRAAALAAPHHPNVASSTESGPARLRITQAPDTVILAMIHQWTKQIRHMHGGAGLRWIAGAMIAAIIVSIAVGWLLKLPGWLTLLAGIGMAALAAVMAFLMLRSIFRRRFVDGFPDALDLIIRAVRAGVPAVRAIQAAGAELPDPVGQEFRLMGDALRLGADQNEVMNAAYRRIGVPEFQFFTVCLQLQRETGGPLAETLENLGSIIRQRREIRLKTRALTAEGRIASKIIALVPIMTTGTLYFIGGDYLDPLLYTQSGHRLLGLAIGMVVTGLMIINHMSKLEG